MPAHVTVGDARGVPIVDIGPFLDGSAKQDVADAVLSSFQNVGFVYLVNHGLAPEKVSTMFNWVRAIFEPLVTGAGFNTIYLAVEKILLSADGD